MTPNLRYVRTSATTLVLTLWIAGCAHSGSSTQPAAAPQPSTKPASSGAEQAAAPQPPVAAPEPAPDDEETASWEPEPPRIEDYMREHFVIATWSRDAVINGSIDALREPLQALAAYDYAPVAPGGWMPRIARMQAAARLAASAESFAAAGAGVAEMARECGDCHAEQRRSPYFGPDISAPKTPPPDSLGERMQRHMWAADRMWEGLTAPSNEAWNAGASALSRVPDQSPAGEPPLPQDFIAQLIALRDLGTRALGASTSKQRAEVYGLLLASCAECHTHELQLTF